MLARQPMGLGRCGDAELTTNDMKDGDSRFGHEPRLSPMSRLIGTTQQVSPMTRLMCHLCRELRHP